jgi:hypothetical protein
MIKLHTVKPADAVRRALCERSAGDEAQAAEPLSVAHKMTANLQGATELRNEAIRCNNRMRSIIAELSAYVQKNQDLAEALKSRRLAQRLSDVFNGKERSVQNEIKQNAARINDCLLGALQEMSERNRINLEALAFVRRLSAELCETAEGYCAAIERADAPSRAPEP